VLFRSEGIYGKYALDLLLFFIIIRPRVE